MPTMRTRTTPLRCATRGRPRQNGSLETLAAARKHFQTMIDLNGDLEEAKFARQNLQNIDNLLKTR